MPRLLARLPDPRPDGLDGTAGAREVDVAEPRVAMQVGNTYDGSELPANLQRRGAERQCAVRGRDTLARSRVDRRSAPQRLAVRTNGLDSPAYPSLEYPVWTDRPGECQRVGRCWPSRTTSLTPLSITMGGSRLILTQSRLYRAVTEGQERSCGGGRRELDRRSGAAPPTRRRTG